MSYTLFAKGDDNDDDELNKVFGLDRGRDTVLQLIISLALGISAFLIFSWARPRYNLYQARKRHKNEATALPDLPKTFFGWIVPLCKITEQQVLASAGLDAYVFLTFFKMAIKFLTVTLFFSLVVIKPVHDSYPDKDIRNGTHGHDHNKTKHDSLDLRRSINLLAHDGTNGTRPHYGLPEYIETDYLWMYVAFAYLFSALAIWLVISETRRIIEIRQEYLGTQTTVTDRTMRLSGIPVDLQDEERLKEMIESLDIGKVESVTLCRKWKELDTAMTERMNTLRRLEEAYTIFTGARSVERNLESLPVSQPEPPGPLISTSTDDEQDESTGLMTNGQPHVTPYDRVRPQTTIRYGRWKPHSKRVDAIDYYTNKLREADERVTELRSKEFAPTALAFVTMDSVAACQMTIQAVLDPSPLQIIANQSPSPSDVIWPNTYLSRRSRMARQWSITVLIVLLTIFWAAIFVPIAGLLGVSTISSIFPQVGQFLDDHDNIRSLVNTQLPTLFATILTVIVPYLYYYLSWYQGTIAQGDIELSAISKNFFFTFFNFFVIFTVLGTASNFYRFVERFNDLTRDLRKVAYYLAQSLQRLLTFYVNFIILQGIGLFPFRLLEMGSVVLYPIYLMGAKTPRDYAELVQPPMFSYGFYLPTSLLIFIICTVYSVLRESWQILLAGLIYFMLGHFVYKYQLLYAMDHQQQSTGRAWGMICDRIFVGLIFFQLATAGQLILKNAVPRSLLLLPLVAATVWVMVVYGWTYKPLMKFIALRSIKRGQGYSDLLSPPQEGQDADGSTIASTDLDLGRNVWADADGAAGRARREARKRFGPSALDEHHEEGLRFINPSLVAPLEGVWIDGKDVLHDAAGDGRSTGAEEATV